MNLVNQLNVAQCTMLYPCFLIPLLYYVLSNQDRLKEQSKYSYSYIVTECKIKYIHIFFTAYVTAVFFKGDGVILLMNAFH